MDAQLLDLQALDTRRRELGMGYAFLAQRSGVSLPTVQRILSGNHATASFANVTAVADALGLRLKFSPRDRVEKLRRRQARRKAKRLVRMVQGTSGLEGQAVDPDTVRRLEERTVHELLAGSARRLWGE